jgi:hypothetical protein
VKKAQAEGTLNFYTVPPGTRRWAGGVVDGVSRSGSASRRRGRGFGTAALQDRTARRPSAGNPRADLLLVSNSPWVGFAEQKGVDHRAVAGRHPGLAEGEGPAGAYPKEFLTNSGSAVAQLQPRVIPLQQEPGLRLGRAKSWQDPARSEVEGQDHPHRPTSSPRSSTCGGRSRSRNGGMRFLASCAAHPGACYAGCRAV